MVRTRGGRKRRVAQETDDSDLDQDYPNPPKESRYPKRSTRVVGPQLLGSPSDRRTTRPILRPAVRSVMEAKLVAKQERFQLQHSCEVEEEKPSSSTVLKNISHPPSENDMMLVIQEKITSNDVPSSSLPPCFNLTQFAEGQLHSADEMESANVDGIPRKSRTNEVPTSSACLSTSRSLNLTEFARGLEDDTDNEVDEAESSPGPAYEVVNRHRVKKEIAPLVRAMFERYGDITSECSVKSPDIICFLLERLCDVYQRLEQKKLPDITRAELDKMVDELQFLEAQKLNISWVLEKLQQISETKMQFQKYLMNKDGEVKCSESFEEIFKKTEMQRKHLVWIQKRIAESEVRMAEIQAKGNEYRQNALEIKRHLPSLQDVKHQSLAHGLL